MATTATTKKAMAGSITVGGGGSASLVHFTRDVTLDLSGDASPGMVLKPESSAMQPRYSQGVRIAEVTPGSQADKARLLAGDYIVRVNAKDASRTTPDEVSQRWRERKMREGG